MDEEGGWRSGRRVVVEEEEVGVGGGIESEPIESRFESLAVVIGVAAAQCDERRHEDLAGVGAGVGLRAEAHLAGDDQGSQLALGEVVVSRHGAVGSPVVEPLRMIAKDSLKTMDGRVEGGCLDGIEDLLLQSAGLAEEIVVAGGNAS